MDCLIRYANEEDSKVLGNIHSESWKKAYKAIIPDNILNNISAEKRERYFYRVLSEKLEMIALIFKEGKAVGFITFGSCRDGDLDSSWGEIWGIYLLTEYWNQGLGTKLIHWGINELRNNGFSKISLWVLEKNINARNFYKKLGFHHDGKVNKINLGKELNEYRYILE